MAANDNLHSVWQEFERTILDVIDPPIGAVQRREMRRAFYGGAGAMFGLMMEATTHPNEQVCALNMSVLHDEVLAFAKDLREGRA